MKLKVKKLHPDATIPSRGSPKASGLDLYSLETVVLCPGETKLIKTGIAFEIPDGYEIQVRARSGLSLKTGFRLANGIGTVDSDYTGDCSVIGFHAGHDNVITINPGDRIAQAVLCPVALIDPEEVTDLPETRRGAAGFGSTGV